MFQPMSAPMSNLFFRAEDLSKDFSGKRVLDRVSFSLAPGETLGIIGENGAGKSTLLKIISGIYHPTGGRLFMDGRALSVRSPVDARRAGITMIPQEFNLVESLTVYENVYLGQEETRGPLLARREMIATTGRLLSELDADVSARALIRGLSVAAKQMVEIAKALVHESRLLIMDEPTTTLTGHEIEVLFRVVRELQQKGVAVIFVSHKLDEVKEICDRVMVLRDGGKISEDDTGAITEHQMAERMVGRELSEVFPPKTIPGKEPVLRVHDLSIPGRIHGVSLELKKGEILGIAGLVGAGRTELAEAIVGLRARKTGEIYVDGEPCRIRNLGEAVARGLAYISEDRQGKGILQGFSIPENISLISLEKYCRLGFIRSGQERESSAQHVERFNIKAPSLEAKLRRLSGGNQQKTYLARWMDTDPRVLILDEPTRGIDVHAKREIYRFINKLSRSGISCIMISSELEEVIGLCSRVLVMRRGRLTGELRGTQITERNIMYHATGLEGSPASGGSYDMNTAPP